MSRKKADTRPDPLTPEDLDLRALPAFLLDVQRFTDSDLCMLPDPEARWTSMLAFCKAWHQVPAASLPNDDAKLAYLLGFGRDVNRWRQVRAAGGLHGFIECRDNRLYHPVLAAVAIEAGLKHRNTREKLAEMREAKARKEAAKKTKGGPPPQEAVENIETDPSLQEPLQGASQEPSQGSHQGPSKGLKRSEENPPLSGVRADADARAGFITGEEKKPRMGAALTAVAAAAADASGAPAAARLSRAVLAQGSACVAAFDAAVVEVFGNVAPRFPDHAETLMAARWCASAANAGMPAEEVPALVKDVALAALRKHKAKKPGDVIRSMSFIADRVVEGLRAALEPPEDLRAAAQGEVVAFPQPPRGRAAPKPVTAADLHAQFFAENADELAQEGGY